MGHLGGGSFPACVVERGDGRHQVAGPAELRIFVNRPGVCRDRRLRPTISFYGKATASGCRNMAAKLPFDPCDAGNRSSTRCAFRGCIEDTTTSSSAGADLALGNKGLVLS